jgi:uncharacterized protein YyaL (SSP411 family)
MLLALDRYLGPAYELVLVADLAHGDAKHAIAAIHRRYLPRAVIAVRDSTSADSSGRRSSHLDELFAARQSPPGQPVLYICQNFACQKPAVGLAAIESQLNTLGQGTAQ